MRGLKESGIVIKATALSVGSELLLEVWQRHCYCEFVMKDAKGALATMSDNPYVSRCISQSTEIRHEGALRSWLFRILIDEALAILRKDSRASRPRSFTMSISNERRAYNTPANSPEESFWSATNVRLCNRGRPSPTGRHMAMAYWRSFYRVA
jgi:hypothetical protein